MSFETKYLIRWGIPGWMFLFWIVLNLFIQDHNLVINKINFDQLSKIIGILISFGVVGVVIGYVFHQLYFLLLWILNKDIDKTVNMVRNYPKPRNWGKNQTNDYFHLEYTWHKQLLKVNDEARVYITDRYRYLLSTVHGHGTMLISQFISSAVTMLPGYIKYGFHVWLHIEAVLYVVQILISVVFIFSFTYYTKNLRSFQGFVLNDLINNNLPEIKK
ncbi:BA5345 family protein [Bacillus subtilis]|uniref:hypothetical protein n=1 Tax=Bacillus TaxID=1386 RepID=UPI00254EA766|nr:hypothetical protein [Bacillus subtilis]MDK7659262.1 hypothetical protein [Bacillus subtilis]MEC3693557.1 hypothetical protein [Bacillus subtilis]